MLKCRVEALEKFIVRTVYRVGANNEEQAEAGCRAGTFSYESVDIEEGDEEWIETISVEVVYGDTHQESMFATPNPRKAAMSNLRIQLVLPDADPSWNGQQEITLVVEPCGVSVAAQGYGDFGSADGYGSPVYLELYQGALRLVVWPDIHEEEPLIIDLAGAKEHPQTDGHR